MRLIKSGLFLASAATLLVVSACNPAQDPKSADSKADGPVAATVNGEVISQRTIDMLVEQGAGSGRPDTPETRLAIINQLTLQMLMAEEAIKKGLDKTSEFSDQMKVIKQSVLANAYVQDYIKNYQISDDMVKAEYERVKATITGNEYKARHILVESEAEANDIIAQLNKDPADFEKLAMEKSKDAGSSVNGGDLGWFDLDRMVPEFSTALSNLEKGTFTEAPVQTQFGYHVILLEDIKPIEAPPLEEVAPQIAEQLQQQSWEQQMEALKAGATIEVVGAAAAESPPADTAAP